MKSMNSCLKTVCLVASILVPGSALAADLGPLPAKVTGSKTRHWTRLDSSLDSFVAGNINLETLETLGFRVHANRVQVVAEIDPAAKTAVVAEMGRLAARDISSARNFVQADVPLDALATLASFDGVLLVRQPYYAYHPEPAPEPAVGKALSIGQTSEGVAAMNADAWHSAGFDGDGVKIGVIDSGFGGYDQLLGSDLPSSSRLHYRAFGSVSLNPEEYHGTACAEIVYDTAPGAEFYLAHVSTGTDFLNALEWLQENGVDAISMSLSWYFPGPGDGTGWMQDAITDDIEAHGTLWAVSAGNYRQRHWQHASNDADGNGWVELDGGSGEVNYFVDSDGEPLELAAGDEVWVRSIWNDWSSVTADYDLYLYRWDATEETWVREASSERTQSGASGERPYESLTFDVATPGVHGFAIARTSVSGTHDLEVFSSNYLDVRDEEGSISQPSDTANILSVAASGYTSPFSSHSYSSMGPANGPGGSFHGGATRPDITGYAGVSTVSYGPQAFYGTSAACPHAAGAAALVLGANPTWTGGQARSYLLNNARDLGPAGKDTTYGRGRLYLGDPPTASGGGGGGGNTGATTCGNAGYDSGTTEGAAWFGGGQAGNPDKMYAVRFRLSDFGYQPGQVEITGFCAGNSMDFGGLWPNEVFVYPDSGGQPNTSSPLAHGTIRTGNGSGASEIVFSSPVTLTSDFWLVNRGYGPHTGEDFNMEFDNQANNGHSYLSSSGAANLQLGTSGNYVLRATLQPKSGGGGGGGGGNAGDFTYHVAAIAHASGVGGAVWKSKLGLLNRSGTTAHATLTYIYGGAGNASVQWATLANGELRTWDDAAVKLFGVGGSTAGSVLIESDQPLVITARTYTESWEGSFGSFLPGVDASEGLAYNELGVISQLTGNRDFRTNVGLVNLVDTNCSVRVRVYGVNGSALGSAKTVTISGNSYKQINDVFKATGAGTRNDAYVTVEVTTPGCTVWGYGAVIDGTTSSPGTDDATSIPMTIVR